MSLTASRLPREDHPPLCRALRMVMDVMHITGVELAQLLGRSQSAVARYYAEREPDLAMTVEIEKALGLPGGALFALGGYTPSMASSDVLAALAADASLTDPQRMDLLRLVVETLRRNETPQPNLRGAVESDVRLPRDWKSILSLAVDTYRKENSLQGV